MVDEPPSFRVLLALQANADEVADRLKDALGDNLTATAVPSGIGTSVSVLTSAPTQLQAEAYARNMISRALGVPVRVVMTVTL